MIYHFVFPHKHKKRHRKAHLISIKALSVYLVIFLAMQLSFSLFRITQPGVLGTTSSITRQEIIDLTNKERQQYNRTILKENRALDKAAEAKAKNMFAENYWAHVSPSGITPWIWIKQADYKYLYAGENLARGYTKSEDVMAAWMASKMGHKENVLGDTYQEIGIAVEDGIINGEKTTLVVQMFGTPEGTIIAKSDEEIATTDDNKIATTIPSNQVHIPDEKLEKVTTILPTQQSFLSSIVTINPDLITKNFSLFLIALLSLVGLIDLVIMWRKHTLVTIHRRYLPHGSAIIGLIIIYFMLQIGTII